jgi:integrase
MPQITKTLVDKSTPKASRYYVWDDSLPGFGLVVQPTGTKSYCYQYRNQYGVSGRIRLGKHGQITAQEARNLAKDHAANVRKGGDPLAEKRAARGAVKVKELMAAYLDSSTFANKSELTQQYDRGRVERHIVPLIGNKIAEKLSHEDLSKLTQDITKGKTAGDFKTGFRGLARVRGGPGAARMCVRLIKSAYTWAHTAACPKLIKENPVSGFKVSKDARKVVNLSTDEYRAVFEALSELERHRAIRQEAADAIRVIALTGARRGEIAGLRWRHLDMKQGRITLPPAEHKSGKKTGEPKKISLNTTAQEIIVRQASGNDDDFVFPPTSGKGPIQLSKPWVKVRKKAGLKRDIGLHGLRHAYASNMARTGHSAPEIMSMLGHKNLSTSQLYIKDWDEDKKDLAERASAGISATLNGVSSPNTFSAKDED